MLIVLFYVISFVNNGVLSTHELAASSTKRFVERRAWKTHFTKHVLPEFTKPFNIMMDFEFPIKEVKAEYSKTNAVSEMEVKQSHTQHKSITATTF